MSEFLNFVLALSIIIVAAKGLGYVSSRFGQPSVLGELIAGLLLGPTLFDMLHSWPMFAHDEHLGESIRLMAELGVLLLMMLAGLELELSELLRSGKASALSGVLGVFVPLGMGYAVGRLFGISNAEAVFVGLALSATSVSISAQTLIELNVLRSRVGLTMLGAAVFDDILVILLLSIGAIVYAQGAGTADQSGIGSILMTLLRMVGYLGVASAVGFFVLPRLTSFVNRLPISQGLIAFALVTALLFGWAAEVLGGIAAITGSFMVGLFLARSAHRAQIEHGIATLAYGFFVPIFFVNIGLEVNLRAISGSAWWFAILLTAIAIASKIIGSGFGARMSGFSYRESLQLGIGMVSRGEVGLIVGAFALSEGLLSQEIFSIVVFMVIVATLVTPPMLRTAFRGERQTTAV